jgi:hypothetical protein
MSPYNQDYMEHYIVLEDRYNQTVLNHAIVTPAVLPKALLDVLTLSICLWCEQDPEDVE